MGWLTDSIPDLGQAGYMGQLEGSNRALRESLDEWISYARTLEKKVKFYRAEAVNGWAAWKAAEKITKNKFNYDLKNDPELMKTKGEFLDEMSKAVDRDVDAAMKNKQ